MSISVEKLFEGQDKTDKRRGQIKWLLSMLHGILYDGPDIQPQGDRKGLSLSGCGGKWSVEYRFYGPQGGGNMSWNVWFIEDVAVYDVKANSDVLEGILPKLNPAQVGLVWKNLGVLVRGLCEEFPWLEGRLMPLVLASKD